MCSFVYLVCHYSTIYRIYKTNELKYTCQITHRCIPTLTRIFTWTWGLELKSRPITIQYTCIVWIHSRINENGLELILKYLWRPLEMKSLAKFDSLQLLHSWGMLAEHWWWCRKNKKVKWKGNIIYHHIQQHMRFFFYPVPNIYISGMLERKIIEYISIEFT